MMISKIGLVLFGLVSMFLLVGCNNFRLDSYDKSAVDANQKDLSPNFALTLKEYFRLKTSKNVTIQFDLLRKGGTETGIAFPKYYAWVEIFEGTSRIERGAVRVAEVDTGKYEVTHYLADSEIESDPDIVYSIFPKELGDRIIKKVK